MPNTDIWADAEVIYTYTRAQAIEDGFLIDVTHDASGSWFPHPGCCHVGPVGDD